MKIKSFIIAFIIAISTSCSSSKLENSEKFKPIVMSFSSDMKSGEIERLKKITTKNGLESLILVSDSLKNDSFFKNIGTQFENFEIYCIKDYDSIVVLCLSEPDDMFGSAIFLKKENGKFRIDSYRGGK